MRDSVQVRIRVKRKVADRLLSLDPKRRGKIASAAIGAALADHADLERLTDALDQLRGIGTNLNQLIHQINAGRALDPMQGFELGELLREIRNLV